MEVADDQTHLWFDLQVPGGNEIDVLLVHESIGSFVIEVKAVSLSMITAYSLDSCAIEKRRESRHPVKQAHWALGKLRDFLKDVGVERPPFFFATACFSKIDRADMQERFQPAGIAGRALEMQLESIFLQEDAATWSALRARLLAIAARPPVGPTLRRPAPSDQQLADLIEATTGRSAKQEPTVPGPGRPQFIAIPGKSQKDSIKKFLAPGQRLPVVLTGRPGTGKTQALLDIAISHAEAGRSVLFTCFNKVLATSLRASLAGRDVPSSVGDRLLVRDVYDIKSSLKDEELAAFSGTFHTVCVDEAQDMSTDDVDFVGKLAAPSAEWFFGDGPGQELYDYGKDEFSPASSRLAAAREPGRGVAQQLRRNFRSGAAGMIFAHGLFDTDMDAAKAHAWAAEHPLSDRGSDYALEFELTGPGEMPIISRVGGATDDSRVEAYAKEIQQELATLRQVRQEGNLIIMVPRPGSDEAVLVRRALDLVKVPYLDQTAEGNRRQALTVGQVRLVTVHSARGVQGARAILFGAHELAFGGSRKLPPSTVSRNCGYIALTRATHGTRVVVAEGKPPSAFLIFIDALSSALRAN